MSKQPTTQDLFNTMVQHLRKQFCRAMLNQVNQKCAYRSHDGLKCAVGVLITDAHYSEALEDKGVCRTPVRLAIEASIGRELTTKEMSLLCEMQTTHDSFALCEWEEQFILTAQAFGLQLPPRQEATAMKAPNHKPWLPGTTFCIKNYDVQTAAHYWSAHAHHRQYDPLRWLRWLGEQGTDIATEAEKAGLIADSAILTLLEKTR